MKRFALIPAFAALAACEGGFDIPDFRPSGSEPAASSPAAAQPAPTVLTAKERLVAATEANGCIINITTIATIMSAATIGNDELPGLVTELENEGRIAPEGEDGLRLTTPACTA